MFTMHSTLLVGQYDWQAERLPREEFAARIADFWKRMPPGCAGIAVYGDRRFNAELAYFTNLVPKLRDALALIPRTGAARLLVSGGKNAMPPAARQTWFPGVDPLNDIGQAIAQWKAELGGAAAFIGGAQLRQAVRKGVDEALGDGHTSEAASVLRDQMRAKRPRELSALREAGAMLKAVAQELSEAKKSGMGVTGAMVQAEHVAIERGAQEVRSLFSLDGGRTLRPFISPVDQAVDPLQVYVAVRHLGYWADGHISLAKAPNAARDKAQQLLDAVVGAATPGAKCSDLVQLMNRSLAPHRPHSVTEGSAGSGIGLALEEAPFLAPGSEEQLQIGDVCSMRVGVSSDSGEHAIVSAMIAVNESGNEVLWRAV